MRIHTAADGCLRVHISHQELARLKIDFRALRQKDARAQRIIHRILQLVCAKKGISPHTTLAVRAIPSVDGCVLHVLPTITSPQNNGIYIFAPSLAALPKLQEICQRAGKDRIISTALYAYGSGYRLLLYTTQLSDALLALLSEHAVLAGRGKLAAAHIAEHGKALFIGENSQCV